MKKTEVTKLEIMIYILLFVLFFLGAYWLPRWTFFLFTNPFAIGTLLFIIAAIGYFHRNIALGLLSVFVILYISITKTEQEQKEKRERKEGYSNNNNQIQIQPGWTKELIQEFLQFQDLHHPNYIFDMNIIQQQVTPKEVKEYVKTGKWKWSRKIKKLYEQTLANDVFVSVNPITARNDAQQLYNETAIKELLVWTTKEGKFILNGAVIGHTKGLPKNANNLVQCGIDGQLTKVTNQRIEGDTGFMIQNNSVIQPEELPLLLNGFSFLNEPCNPCSALNEKPSYNCPFTLDIGDGGEISPIWAYLWGIKQQPTKQKKGLTGVIPRIVDDPFRLQINTNF